MLEKNISKIYKKVLDNVIISVDECFEIYECDIDEIAFYAKKIREFFCGDKFDLCTIINVKSGKCPEDCKYCAQSAHYKTGAKVYDTLGVDEVLDITKSNEAKGVHRISLVSSGRGLKFGSDNYEKIINLYKNLKANSKLSLCGSFGICDIDTLRGLKDVGLSRFHHNLETSREFFNKICSTHSYDDRINTIKNAQSIGLEVCSGGIFGLGESIEDRFNMALELRNLGIKSTPINILTPIKGTPLGDLDGIDENSIIKCSLIYRFILPDSFIRFAGGRALIDPKVCIQSGINSLLSGDYLTTTGSNIEDDIKMVSEYGYKI